MRLAILSVIGLSVGLLSPAVVQAKTPRRLRGKVFFAPKPLPESGKKGMVKQFAKKRRAEAELSRGKAKVWKATLFAVLKRRPYAGPLTVWWYDKSDRASFRAKEPAHAISFEGERKRVIVREIEMDPNVGLNKNRTYRIYVGQIVNGRHRYYARGELTLRP